MYLRPISENDLRNIIDKLPNKNSSGWDGLSNNLIKKLSDVILKPLHIIVNQSIQEGIFPGLMKLAHVTPLFKLDSVLDKNNYRPISLLMVLSKILEKAIYRQLYSFLQTMDKMYLSQYGFRKKHSCENAIQELLSSVLKNKENKKFTAAIFLDLSKAFDTLDHRILLLKMERYGIRGLVLGWCKSYLENRTMCVRSLAGTPPSLEVSETYNIDYGVPQGSCLGPLLFLIYCNDLPLNLTTSKSILFADDATIYRSHANLCYLKWCLETDLNLLLDWFYANKLTLNLSKSVCMLFHGPVGVNFTLAVRNISILTVKVTKFLGVLIDDHLKWDQLVSKLIIKIKRNDHLLKTGKCLLSIHAKKLIYFAHTQSHINYSLLVWGNMVSTTQLSRLQNEQDKCLKLIHKNWSRSKLQILSVRDLIELENAKFGYKLANGLLPGEKVNCTKTDSSGKSLVKNIDTIPEEEI